MTTMGQERMWVRLRFALKSGHARKGDRLREAREKGREEAGDAPAISGQL